MLSNTSSPLPSNTTEAPVFGVFYPVVDMGEWGMCVIEVQAHTYADAYRGAVEQWLTDPHGTLRHTMAAKLRGDL